MNKIEKWLITLDRAKQIVYKSYKPRSIGISTSHRDLIINTIDEIMDELRRQKNEQD